MGSDDESDDLLKHIENELARRRFGEPIRLEVAADLSDAVSYTHLTLPTNREV